MSVGSLVENVSLSLRAGEIVGLSGLLGSGRTELALALFGMKPDHGGSILIDGTERRLASVQDAIAAGVAYVPEDRLSEGLFMSQSIARNNRLQRHRPGDTLVLRRPAARGGNGGRHGRGHAHRHADIEKPVGQLSGGNQQRVVIGRWLLTDRRC